MIPSPTSRTLRSLTRSKSSIFGRRIHVGSGEDDFAVVAVAPLEIFNKNLGLVFRALGENVRFYFLQSLKGRINEDHLIHAPQSLYDLCPRGFRHVWSVRAFVHASVLGNSYHQPAEFLRLLQMSQMSQMEDVEAAITQYGLHSILILAGQKS